MNLFEEICTLVKDVNSTGNHYLDDCYMPVGNVYTTDNFRYDYNKPYTSC